MANKVCVITGVGPGTGTALVERFIEGGYDVAMIARSQDRLVALSEQHEKAHAYPCDVLETDRLQDTLVRIKSDLGSPSVLIHNAVGGAFGDFMEVDPKSLQLNFDINTMAMLHLARMVAPDMIAAGSGAILATGNTSAYRGIANYAAFAPTKAAQRILMESIARSAGPKGVHVAYIAIDAIIDVPWARQAFKDKPDDFFCQPADIAGEIYHVAHQPRSTWTMDVVIRPFGEKW